MSAALGVVFFVLTIPIAIFLLPFLVKRFAQNEVTDYVIRGSCFVIASFLMALSAAVVADLAIGASLGLSTELYTYMFILQTLGYVGSAALMVVTTLKAIQIHKHKDAKERMGESSEEH